MHMGAARYPQAPPYHPDTVYAEYPFGSRAVSDEGNAAYAAVRGAFALLEMDAAHAGTKSWNPLGGMVRPGDKVVLKPNFVRDFRESSPAHADCVVTHGSVIRAVVDYVYIALSGRGRIVIADAPQNDADFGALRRIAGLDELCWFYRSAVGFDVEVYDLRPEVARKVDGVIVGHTKQPGDPDGYVKVNLSLRSAFREINHLCHLLYGSEYDMSALHRHQHDDTHEYLISGTVLRADCVISMPKLKTHKKVGLTVNMKNLVGINGDKNWLPHHREGTPGEGGDQFPDDGLKNRIERSTVARFKRVFPLLGPLRPVVAGPLKLVGKRVFGDTNVDRVRSGNWWGNDTTWRTVLDLNRILHYADETGTLHDRPVRRFASIVDGIVAGEGNGPLDPTPKPVGAVLFGTNPVAVDYVCAGLMGFDVGRVPMLARAFEAHGLPLVDFAREAVVCRSNDSRFDGVVSGFPVSGLSFRPHFGWAGHVELDAAGEGRGG